MLISETVLVYAYLILSLMSIGMGFLLKYVRKQIVNPEKRSFELLKEISNWLIFAPMIITGALILTSIIIK